MIKKKKKIQANKQNFIPMKSYKYIYDPTKRALPPRFKSDDKTYWNVDNKIKTLKLQDRKVEYKRCYWTPLMVRRPGKP